MSKATYQRTQIVRKRHRHEASVASGLVDMLTIIRGSSDMYDQDVISVVVGSLV